MLHMFHDLINSLHRLAEEGVIILIEDRCNEITGSLLENIT